MVKPRLFTCTFCRTLRVGTPHELGRSRRLACAKCSEAVMHLSICWGCGELVVRGEESVALGWCFWHRACYGCLFYGRRGICRGVTARALFGDEARRGGFGRAREVTEPPLCAMCARETGADTGGGALGAGVGKPGYNSGSDTG